MVNLWTLGGLSWRELARRTWHESWQDAVFGQGGRMAFYHFLAVFPSLLLFFAVTARLPHVGPHLKETLADLSRQVLPNPASALVTSMIDELNQRALSRAQVIPASIGALWASLNGTWAMIFGLNTAYEVKEQRPWWKLSLTIVGLALSLAVTGTVAVFLIFCGTAIQTEFLNRHVSLAKAVIAFRALQWITLICLLLFSFALLYRFGPNLRDHQWRWSTPGAVVALVLWIASTFAARFYFEHVNNYERIYGHLNAVAMLLLWLYVSNGAILIGGEMNSEIEKAAVDHEDVSERSRGEHSSAADRSGT